MDALVRDDHARRKIEAEKVFPQHFLTYNLSSGIIRFMS